MSQILRLQGQVYHIPSIARTRFYSSPFLGLPVIKIVNHSGDDAFIKYRVSQWDVASRDYMRLENSRAVCYEALKQVPMMEPTSSDPPQMATLPSVVTAELK
jgi:hypothetical protein